MAAPSAPTARPVGTTDAARGLSAERRPTRTIQLINFVAFQAAWFAAVLGAAHHLPARGTACVAATLAWHLAVSARPAQEARLIVFVTLIGFLIESAIASQGHVRYPSGQPDPHLAPYWMVALWALLEMATRVAAGA